MTVPDVAAPDWVPRADWSACVSGTAPLLVGKPSRPYRCRLLLPVLWPMTMLDGAKGGPSSIQRSRDQVLPSTHEKKTQTDQKTRDTTPAPSQLLESAGLARLGKPRCPIFATAPYTLNPFGITAALVDHARLLNWELSMPRSISGRRTSRSTIFCYGLGPLVCSMT